MNKISGSKKRLTISRFVTMHVDLSGICVGNVAEKFKLQFSDALGHMDTPELVKIAVSGDLEVTLLHKETDTAYKKRLANYAKQQAREKDMVARIKKSQGVPAKEECFDCKLFNLLGQVSYKCAVKGTCPALVHGFKKITVSGLSISTQRPPGATDEE